MRVTAPAQIREPEDLAFLSATALDEERLEIDLTDIEWISPLGVVAVLATCLRADEASLHTTVELPENLAARTYLAQIGLVAELARCEWTVPDNIDIDPNADIGPHLPVSRLTTEREVVAASYQLDDALHRASLAGGLFDDLIDVAVELAGNAREHGSNCYTVAQTHTGRRSGTPGLHLAVADFGAGFSQTLREIYGEMTDSEAIIRAFEEQVSGTGQSRRGFGLTQIAGVVDMAPDNVLHIVSRSGHVVRSGRRFTSTESESLLFPGTLASVYVPYG